MPVQLVKATAKDHDLLFNLAQFYQYDFTDFLGGDVDAEGLFPYMSVNYYLGQGRQAYIARIEDHPAGFALVDEQIQLRSGPGRYLAEFFVMRRFRRKGIGRQCAFQVFDTYRGYWEIAEVGPNQPAIAFWRKVIGEYTRGRFEESTTQEDGLKIVWQTFNSAAW